MRGKRGLKRWAVPALGLLAAATALGLAGVGPEVPGLKPRVWLGLADEVRELPPPPPCSPARAAARLHTPPGRVPGKWRRERPSPLARVELKAVASGGRIFLANGQAASGIPLPKVLAFDPVRRRYAPIPDAPQGVDHALLAAYRGDLYVVGGYVRGRPTGKVWRYSSRTGRWTGRAPLRVARGGLDGAVIGGRLYAAGGAPRTYPEVYAKPYATLEVYDFRRNRWLPGPDMPTARHHVAATALGGRLYVLGGRTPEDFSVTDVERFDPRSGRWEKLTPLPLGVGDFSAVTARGQVVAIGGDEEENMEEGKGWVTPAVWSLDPSRGTWKRLPDLRRARHGHGAAVARDRIYVFEGGACPGFSRMRAVESIGFDEAGL